MWSGYGQEVLMRADDAVHAPLHRGALVIDALFDDFLHLPTYTGTSQGSIISTIYVSRTHLLHSACSVPTKKTNTTKKIRTNTNSSFVRENQPAPCLVIVQACACVIYVFMDLFQSAYIGIFTQKLWNGNRSTVCECYMSHAMRTPQNPGLAENLVIIWCWNPIWHAEQTPKPFHSKVITNHFPMYIGGPKITASRKQHWQQKQSKPER